MAAGAFLLLALLTAAFQAEIVDRLAVTLDNEAIAESEIILEIRLAAFLNGDRLDFSPEIKRKAANRLIEQKLIRKEIELGRYTQPAPEEVEPMLKPIQARFQDPEEFRQALNKYGIGESDLKAYLLWQITLLRFIDIRFRPAVQVTDDDMQKYFNQHLAEWERQAAPGKKIAFDDVRDRILQTLTDQRVDEQLDQWLAQTRKRTRIEFHQEAFQ
jgi:hypothetical protein